MEKAEKDLLDLIIGKQNNHNSKYYLKENIFKNF
jgi:hypothetical protein